MAEVGRPTELTDEVLEKIKQGILEGKTLKEIAETSEINEGTLYQWSSTNYSNLGDKLENWRLKAKLIKAESRADEILSLPLHNKENEIDSAVLRTVQKEAEFIRKTLAKDVYSERKEMSGPNGEAPIPILATAYVQTDNSNKEDNEPREENTSSTGGNISEQDNQHSPLLDSLGTDRQESNTD